MSQTEIAFAKRYALFMRVMSWLTRIRPAWLYALMARTLGRWFNPFMLRRRAIQDAMASVLPARAVSRCWYLWLDSHIRFVHDFFQYDALDTRWLREMVCVRDTNVLAELRSGGGLLLTYHTHHQNTLCCALGLAGCEVSAVAAAPQDSPLFAYIGSWAQRVNAASQLHFRGGRYIFLNDMRALAVSAKDALARRSVLVSLCDFDQSGAEISEFELLGRMLRPPVGMIELALRQRAAVFLAMFAPQARRLELQLIRLPDGLDTPQVVQAYLAFLEQCVRENPSCWQGWEWLGTARRSESNRESRR